MAQGRYQRKKQRNLAVLWVCICVLIVVLCLVGTILLLHSRKDDGSTPTTTGTVAATQGTTAPTQTATVPTEATTTPTEETTTAPTEETTAPTEETTEPTEVATVPGEEELAFGQAVAQLALAQVGKPYQHGGQGPDSFDTSGLVYYCFRENGLSVSRLVSGLTAGGQAVEKEQLQPGDVVFFWTENEGEAEYVGIYVGDGKFVAARHSDKPVTEMDLSAGYFAQRFVCARRYEPENKD